MPVLLQFGRAGRRFGGSAMIAAIVLLWLSLSSCGGVARPQRVKSVETRAPSSPAVFVLGTIHGFHSKAAYAYSYLDLGNQIRAMRPDAVCAEITTNDLDGTREAMFPWEVVVVDEAARAVGATFVGADWRPDLASAESTALQAEMNPAEKTAFDAVYADFMPLFERAGARTFEFWHDHDTQERVRKIHDRMIEAGTEAAAGFWETRNQIVVKRCMRKVMAAGAKRVLFVFGAEHKYAIEGYVKRFYGLRAEPVVRLVPHASGSLSPSIVSRWQRNRESLARLIETKTLPPALADQFNERYLRRLDATIEARGQPR